MTSRSDFDFDGMQSHRNKAILARGPLALGDCDHDLAAHDMAFEMRIGVAPAGLIVVVLVGGFVRRRVVRMPQEALKMRVEVTTQRKRFEICRGRSRRRAIGKTFRARGTSCACRLKSPSPPRSFACGICPSSLIWTPMGFQPCFQLSLARKNFSAVSQNSLPGL